MSTALAAAVAMDRMYRWQRYIYDLTRKYYLLGRDRLIRRLDAHSHHQVLEIGCGTGRNLIVASRLFPAASFFGIDVSSEMLASARSKLAGSRRSRRIALALGDATGFDPAAAFGADRFDRIFISYSLSMIPQQRQVLRHSLSLLSPGGQLHIVDFGGQERMPLWLKQALRRWLHLFQVTPCDELEAELRALPNTTFVIERPFGGYAQHAIVTLRGASPRP